MELPEDRDEERGDGTKTPVTGKPPRRKRHPRRVLKMIISHWEKVSESARYSCRECRLGVAYNRARIEGRKKERNGRIKISCAIRRGEHSVAHIASARIRYRSHFYPNIIFRWSTFFPPQPIVRRILSGPTLQSPWYVRYDGSKTSERAAGGAGGGRNIVENREKARRSGL